MANIQAAAIITRIQEVVDSGKGTLRTIATGTYTDNWPAGLDEAENQRRAFEGPRTRVNVMVTGRSPNSPPINSNLIIYDATITVVVSRLLDREKQIAPDDYNAVQAAAMADADIIRQALEWPDNLKQTEAGAVTDIVSGMLRWDGTPPSAVIGQVNDGAQRLETTHSFSAQVIARPAT